MSAAMMIYNGSQLNSSDSVLIGDVHPSTNPKHLVWIYGLLLVTGINLCSLLGLALNPFSRSRFYRAILLYMVALAVGVLAGSSLLFLLYDAVEDKSWGDHILRDFKAKYNSKVNFLLGSVFIFFNFEQALKVLLATVMSRRKQPNDPAENGANFDALKETRTNGKPRESSKTSPATWETNDYMAQADEIGEIENFSDLPVSTITHHHPHTQITHAVSLDLSDDEDGDEKIVSLQKAPSKTKIEAQQIDLVPRRPTSSPPTVAVKSLHEVQPVAWMVIFGDGIHNLADGLAIGAAFATGNMSQGISVCIAVLAEELPHEIGDFAVLIKSGLSIRRALLLNFMSACLCYFGFVIGMFVGESPDASAVISSLAAGLFLYISMSDLLPELSPESSHEGAGHGHSHDWNGNSNEKRCESTGSSRGNHNQHNVHHKSNLKRLLIHMLIVDSGLVTGYVCMAFLSNYSDALDHFGNSLFS